MGTPRQRAVFGACLTQFMVIGLLFAYGVFMKSFEDAFGWSRTLLSGASALAFFMMGLLAIVGGRLNDLIGPRPVLAVTGICYGVGFALLSQISQPWHLYLIFGTLLALGLGTHDVVTLGTIARWYDKRRGIMSGVIKVGTAGGQMVMPPVAAVLIMAYGWQSATVVIGIAAGVLLLIAALAMSAPQVARGTTTEQSGIDFATARRGRVMWTLCTIQLLIFSVLMTIPTHLAIYAQDLGMSAATGALLLSVMGGASVFGRLVIGMTVDRIGGRGGITLNLITLLVATMGFCLTDAPAAIFVLVAIYGVAHGALFVVISPSVAGWFGMRDHGSIFGTILFCGTIGGAIGPIVAGRVYDVTGSYQIAFVGLSVAVAIALGLARTLPGRGG